MTKVLLSKTYKARKPGVVFDIPQGEADSLVALGIGDIPQGRTGRAEEGRQGR